MQQAKTLADYDSNIYINNVIVRVFVKKRICDFFSSLELKALVSFLITFCQASACMSVCTHSLPPLTFSLETLILSNLCKASLDIILFKKGSCPLPEGENVELFKLIVIL